MRQHPVQPGEFARAKIRQMRLECEDKHAAVLSAGERVRELVLERQAAEARVRHLEREMRYYSIDELETSAQVLNGREQMSERDRRMANDQRHRLIESARAKVAELTADLDAADQHRAALAQSWESLLATVNRIAPAGSLGWEIQGRQGLEIGSPEHGETLRGLYE
jgi:chromosome segregation ATPase